MMTLTAKTSPESMVTGRRAPGHGVLAGKYAATVPLFPLPGTAAGRAQAGAVLHRRNVAALALAAAMGPCGAGKQILKRVGQRQAAQFRLLAEGGAR